MDDLFDITRKGSKIPINLKTTGKVQPCYIVEVVVTKLLLSTCMNRKQDEEYRIRLMK